MVLSLAFILAFIGASVALLIGIIVFSQVQDDMLKTFGDPVQVGTTPVEEIISKNGGLSNATPLSLSNNVARGNVPIPPARYGLADGLTVGSTITHIRVHVVLGGTANYGLYEGGNLVAQTGVVSGLGLQEHALQTPYVVHAGTSLHFGGTSLTGSSTVLRTFAVGFSGSAIEYVDLLFGLTYPNLPINYVGSGGNLGTNTSYGYELKQVTEIPIFESQVPPEFITASNIAYTVIGIIPVALFFFLFAIFSGRVE